LDLALLPAIKGKGAMSDVQSAEISFVYRTFLFEISQKKFLKMPKFQQNGCS